MVPPGESKPPFVFDVEIPTQEQVLAEAKEKHATQRAWAGKVGEWIAIYLPPRRVTVAQVNPFTGDIISEPKSSGSTHATFHVGFRLFWDAEVWIQNGGATRTRVGEFGGFLRFRSELKRAGRRALSLSSRLPAVGGS